MSLQIQRKLFTVEEYHKLADVGVLKPTDRVQLINGEIITMSPTKSLHSSLVDDIHEFILVALLEKVIVKSQNPIYLNNHSEPEPDIIIAQLQNHRYRHRHPRPTDIYWLIEVSDSTLQYDRTIKKTLYAKAGIVTS